MSGLIKSVMPDDDNIIHRKILIQITHDQGLLLRDVRGSYEDTIKKPSPSLWIFKSFDSLMFFKHLVLNLYKFPLF